MRFDPARLPATVGEFLRERHLATLSSVRPDGSPHVVPVGFTWDAETGLVRIITRGGSRKVANIRAGGRPDSAGPARVAVCQVDGRRWLALEGAAIVTADPDRVADAVERYARRYRQPQPHPARVAIEVTVDRILGSAPA